MTTDENGDYKSAYTYGLDRISVDTMGINDEKYTPLYYQYNGRGDVTGLINSLDEVKAKYRYDAFGVPKPGVKLDTDANGFITPYGYNSEDYDMYSGLQYLRARYYEPETGRFLTRDSYLGNVMSSLSENRYIYTQNNPLMYIDPSGHSISNTVNGKDTSDDRHESHAREGIVMAEEMGGKVQTLQVGSSGEEVRDLQQKLIDLGDLAPGEADGDFGTKTYNAVVKFQTEQDIGIDGIVGKQTLIQLQTAINMKRDDETANFIAKNNPNINIQDKIDEITGINIKKVCGGGNQRTSNSEVNFDTGKGFGIDLNTNPLSGTNFIIGQPRGTTVFEIRDISVGRLGKNGVPVGEWAFRVDGSHGTVTNNHVNLNTKLYSTNSIVNSLDHQPIPNVIFNAGKNSETIINIGKNGGKALVVAGAAVDGYSIYQSYEADGERIGNNTIVTSSGVAGSWVGGIGGAKLGAAGGATAGTFICPGIGTAIGGAVGGIGGGIAGAIGGKAAGEAIARKFVK